MKTNITYDFNAFEEATNIMHQCVINLSKKNARLQTATAAMQGLLGNTNIINSPLSEFDKKALAKGAVKIADALIVELDITSLNSL